MIEAAGSLLAGIGNGAIDGSPGPSELPWEEPLYFSR